MRIFNIVLSIDKYLGQRFDKSLFSELLSMDAKISRTYLKSVIENGGVEIINNKIEASQKIKVDIQCIVKLPPIESKKIMASNIDLDIVFEDEYLLVINKQAGIVSHPGAGNYDNTVVNALLNYCPQSLSDIQGGERLGIVHRLDKDTTGLMIIAKNNMVHQILSKEIAERNIKKTYKALIWKNIIPSVGKIEANIDRHKQHRMKMRVVPDPRGRKALTYYKTLQSFRNNIATFVECILETGRTHQIRVHFSYKKHSLIGDSLYGQKNYHILKDYSDEAREYIYNFPRQALHATKLEFKHPITGKNIILTKEMPNDMQKLVHYLK